MPALPIFFFLFFQTAMRFSKWFCEAQIAGVPQCTSSTFPLHSTVILWEGVQLLSGAGGFSRSVDFGLRLLLGRIAVPCLLHAGRVIRCVRELDGAELSFPAGSCAGAGGHPHVVVNHVLVEQLRVLFHFCDQTCDGAQRQIRQEVRRVYCVVLHHPGDLLGLVALVQVHPVLLVEG